MTTAKFVINAMFFAASEQIFIYVFFLYDTIYNVVYKQQGYDVTLESGLFLTTIFNATNVPEKIDASNKAFVDDF